MSERRDGSEPACEGASIGGRYRVERAIGRGGMGVVYSARHELTQRPVALKLLAPWHGEHASSFELLLNEARSAASVRHVNIVDVLDMGVHDGTPFLVMELLDGVSLEAARASAELSIAQALSWLLPIMGALALMHDRGIVHGDVKPSNIFLVGKGDARSPKLLDFGLARAYDAGLASGQLRYGTPRYMAPEHLAGHALEAQADVWSMGVVFCECLQPDLPEPLRVAIQRALEPDLSRRHATMRSFVVSLVQAATRCGVRLPLDPDPLGLPQFPTWLLMEDELASNDMTRSVEHDRSPLPTPALSELADSHSPAERGAPHARRWLTGLVLTSCVVALSAGGSSSGSGPALRPGRASAGTGVGTRTLAAASHGSGASAARVVERERESVLPAALPQGAAAGARALKAQPRAERWRPRHAAKARPTAVAAVRDAGDVTQRALDRGPPPDDLEPIESEW